MRNLKKKKTAGFVFNVIGVAIIAISSGMLFSSCAHSVNTIENTRQTMKRKFVPNRRIITDKATAGALQVRSINSVTLPSGLLKVQAELWNATKKTYQFSYRFIWLDNNAMVVETPAGTWIQKSIRNGDSAFIYSVAPNAKCKDFKLKIIERK